VAELRERDRRSWADSIRLRGEKAERAILGEGRLLEQDHLVAKHLDLGAGSGSRDWERRSRRRRNPRGRLGFPR